MKFETRIAVTSKSFSNNEFLIKNLKENFKDIKINKENIIKTKNDLINFLKDSDCAIIGLDIIDNEVLEACPKLKYISKYGVGLNNIDIMSCNKHNVKLGWTGGVNRVSVAEMTLGFMIGLSRNLFYSSSLLSKGEWNKNGGFQLSEKSIGIIGCGHIGKEVIRLLKPFNCNIFVNDIIDQSNYYNSNGLKEATKDYIYKNCDIITIHTPLNNETYNMFNLEIMKKCLKKPFLINTARGGIINEKDIVQAIELGIISGAAIDPFENEPLIDKDLYSNPKIVTTPHIGGNAKEAVKEMGEASIKNMIKIIETNESNLPKNFWN